MKKGTRTLMPIAIGVDVDLCSKVEFVFVQEEVRKGFEYPSETAFKSGEREISLDWTAADKAPFAPGKCQLDTRITLADSVYQPDTKIATFKFEDTLFLEVDND